jgi:hypothetical protein
MDTFYNAITHLVLEQPQPTQGGSYDYRHALSPDSGNA